jgi:hypothetical protein
MKKRSPSRLERINREAANLMNRIDAQGGHVSVSLDGETYSYKLVDVNDPELEQEVRSLNLRVNEALLQSRRRAGRL